MFIFRTFCQAGVDIRRWDALEMPARSKSFVQQRFHSHRTLLIAFLLFSAILQYKIQTGGSFKTPITKGMQAPHFTLQDLQGNEVEFATFRGKVVILSFWATWCVPCREAYEELKPWFETKQRAKEWERVVFLAVNVGERSDVVERFARDHGLPFKVVLDTKGEVAARYRVEGIPALFIIDSQGVVQLSNQGYMDLLRYLLDQQVQRLIAQDQK